MKGGRQPHGFTIIEIMIFLAVSGIIFFSAMTLMSGSQSKTEFSTSISQVESQLQSIVGNVANGYYLSQQNFTCTPNPSLGLPPTINFANVSNRGTSLGCTFIGEVIQFDPLLPGLSYQEYVVYPVVGNQFNPPTSTPGPATLDVDNLTQAAPYAFYNNSVDQTQSLHYGITVHPSGMGFADNTVSIPFNNTCNINSVPFACIGAIGFFTTFNGYTGSGGTLQNGSQTVQVIPIPGSSLGQSPLTLLPYIDSLKNDTSVNPNGIKNSSGFTAISNPDMGVEICLDSGTDNESGLITIGGHNSPTSVTLQKYSQKGCV
jgi:type II secretory pathway pseudopilin PulG